VLRGLNGRTLVASVLLGIVIVGGFVATTVAIEGLRSSSAAERRTRDVLLISNALERRVLDLETGLRGYLITDETRFLQPYRAARTEYPKLASQLEALTAGTPEHAEALAIHEAIDEYVREWIQPLLRDGAANLSRARKVVATGGGKRRVDAIRRRFAGLSTAETAIADTRTRHSDFIGSIALAVGIGGAAVSALLILLFATGLRLAVVRPIRRLAVGVEELSGGDLSRRVDEGGTAEIGQLTRGFNVMASSLEEQQTELRSLATRMQTLLDSTAEGIYGIDRSGAVIFANASSYALTGFSTDDLLGRNGHDLIHHHRPDGSPYPVEECPIHVSFEEGMGVRVSDEVFWRKDGSSFPVEYSSAPIRTEDGIIGAVVTFTDISARKLAERQVETQYAVTRAISNATGTDDAAASVLDATIAGLGLSGGRVWLRDDAGEHLVAATGGSEAAGGSPISLDLGEDGRLELEHDQPLEPGDSVALESIAGQLAQFLRRKRAESQVAKAKDEFVANVSHELRTPLTAIYGWVQMILGGEPGPLTEDQTHFLEIAKRNSERLMRLIDDLLLASRIESTADLELELGDVDVAEVVRETFDLLSSAAAGKEITVILDADEPVVVEGDRTRLLQLVSNLGSNAVKYTPIGGTIRVAVAKEDGACVLRVRDTGIGIPMEERDRLFERFFRASTAGEHRIAGTGLGLAISSAIAKSHGGSIRVGDTEGSGTEFVVELPLARGR
jgi:PAS domain S-box-containing protein